MYYSSGNYEAFATPKKPEGIDNKSAYVVGTGLAGLAAACFLIRDAQMPGSHIHILEAKYLLVFFQDIFRMFELQLQFEL